jgi:hypothetical protein
MKPIPLGILASIFAAAALVGVALSITHSDKIRVSSDRLVDKGGIIDARNSPSLARDPRKPNTLVATHRVDRPRFSASLDRSADDGRTWRRTALPLPRGLDRPFAPDAAFAPDGTLYVIYVNLAGTGNVPANLWLSKSLDGGRTLSPPVRIAGKLAFQARVVVDRDGVVHLTWLQAREVGLLALSGPPAPVVTARSDDGGLTFSRPVPVSDPARELVGAASPVIDSDGQLVVLYEDFKGDRRDFQNLEGPAWDAPFGLVVTRPIGRGSFAAGVQLEDGLIPTHRFLAFLPEFPALAAGPGDTLYVAWSDGRNGDEDVFLRRSRDDGATWSAPKRVNDNPKGDRTSQYLPRVDVAPDGRVDVLYLDRRRDRRNVMTDATLASSDDEGDSFQNIRLSSRSFDSRVGARASPQLPVDFGTRLGLSSGNDRSLAVWTDSRLGDEGTGRQDIFSAAYAAAPAPALARPPVIGLLAALALALALMTARARRKGTPQTPREHLVRSL